MAQRPLTRTDDQLREILREEISKILCGNVTIDALRDPYRMRVEDVNINVNLFERLGAAYEALHALYPQLGRHPGFCLDED